jgi:hypothetical protein
MPRLRQFPCGSGEFPTAEHDARGIFLCYACDRCREKKLARYWPDVLSNPNYWHSEPIDED